MGAKVTLEELEGFFVHLRLKLLTLPVWGPWGGQEAGMEEGNIMSNKNHNNKKKKKKTKEDKNDDYP